MGHKECLAMILAGGKGARLGSLTQHVAKPAVPFGGKYRIIDYTLSNCAHSGIDTIGVLTQYRPTELHDYIKDGQTWKLNEGRDGVKMLSSYEKGLPYLGTADAIYQNIGFIDRYDPEYVLILSGDHIYKMDYRKMLAQHKEKDADATISVIPVPWEEASRFGIMSTKPNGKITCFFEKPKTPKSNLASMGIYIFKWSRLKAYLINDKHSQASEHDFGKNIIPAMLSSGEKLYAYRFDGYWRDVGTIQSLWESNMDLLKNLPGINPNDRDWEIFTGSGCGLPCVITSRAGIKNSIVSEGCGLYGHIENSVLCDGVSVGEDAEVVDSILMPGAIIGKSAKVRKAFIGAGTVVDEGAEIGASGGVSYFYDQKICSDGITLIGPDAYIGVNIKILKNSHVTAGSFIKERRLPAVSLDAARLWLAHV